MGVVVETCINAPNTPGVELELNSLMLYVCISVLIITYTGIGRNGHRLSVL